MIFVEKGEMWISRRRGLGRSCNCVKDLAEVRTLGCASSKRRFHRADITLLRSQHGHDPDHPAIE